MPKTLVGLTPKFWGAKNPGRVTSKNLGCQKPGLDLNGVFRFVFAGFGGPGGGFGGFPVGSKSSGKATTTTTKEKAAKTTTRTTKTSKNKTKNKTKQNEKHRLGPDKPMNPRVPSRD